MNLPMIGNEYKTEYSKFQVMLTDKTDKTISPINYTRVNRFFDNIEDRNTFVKLFEESILKVNGKLVHNKDVSHPLFITFNIYDNQGVSKYDLTVYK